MSSIIMIVVALFLIALICLWHALDAIVYKGDAFVMPIAMEHYSKTHRTVHVMPLGMLDVDFLVATVPMARAVSFAKGTTRQVTIRKRFFQEPRVTRIS